MAKGERSDKTRQCEMAKYLRSLWNDTEMISRAISLIVIIMTLGSCCLVAAYVAVWRLMHPRWDSDAYWLGLLAYAPIALYSVLQDQCMITDRSRSPLEARGSTPHWMACWPMTMPGGIAEAWYGSALLEHSTPMEHERPAHLPEVHGLIHDGSGGRETSLWAQPWVDVNSHGSRSEGYDPADRDSSSASDDYAEEYKAVAAVDAL